MDGAMDPLSKCLNGVQWDNFTLTHTVVIIVKILVMYKAVFYLHIL